MNIRQLNPADATDLHSMRLRALKDNPLSFGADYADEAGLSLSVVEQRLATSGDRGVFGVFDGERLAGFAALGRDKFTKMLHKAYIWGMYVAPEYRGRGFGRGLLDSIVTFAWSIPKVCQINLAVNAENKEAVNLYQSAGFIVFGREPNALCIDRVFCDELLMYLVDNEKISRMQQPTT